ncbi:hypothetical protein V6U78_03445 [Marinospirillum sp. MEB164]|uniref:DUF4214 domain-containing protein n=1 Tax=Marinospirillum alkalitolerans TaxID=3123374 RepID=A0ABW8PUZ0_9GAMM
MTSAQQIQQMYIAYYGRPADPAGLAYWTQQAEEQGMDWVTEAFTQGTEATLIQGNKSQPQLINDWYQQAFGRGANQREINEISKKMNDGVSQGQILKELLAQAESNPADKHTLENRTKVADNFTQQVEKTGASYTFNEVAAANSLLLAISPSSNASDIAKAIQALISNVQPGRPLTDAINKAKEEAGMDNSSGSDDDYGSGDNGQDPITVRDLLSFNDTTRAYDIDLTKYNEYVYLDYVPEGRFQASAFLDGTSYYSTSYNLPTPTSQHYLNLMGDWSENTIFNIKESLLANFPGVKGGKTLLAVELNDGSINVPAKMAGFNGTVQLIAFQDQEFSGKLGNAILFIQKTPMDDSATLTVTEDAVLGDGAMLIVQHGATMDLTAVNFEGFEGTLTLSGNGTFLFAEGAGLDDLIKNNIIDVAQNSNLTLKEGEEVFDPDSTPSGDDPFFSATKTLTVVSDDNEQAATLQIDLSALANAFADLGAGSDVTVANGVIGAGTGGADTTALNALLNGEYASMAAFKAAVELGVTGYTVAVNETAIPPTLTITATDVVEGQDLTVGTAFNLSWDDAASDPQTGTIAAADVIPGGTETGVEETFTASTVTFDLAVAGDWEGTAPTGEALEGYVFQLTAGDTTLFTFTVLEDTGTATQASELTMEIVAEALRAETAAGYTLGGSGTEITVANDDVSQASSVEIELVGYSADDWAALVG